MIPLVKMIAAYVTRQVTRGDVALRTAFALISLKLLVVDFSEVFLSRVEGGQRDVAALAGVADAGLMLLGYVILAFRDPIKSRAAVLAGERADLVRPHVAPKPSFRRESFPAILAYKVRVVLVHVGVQADVVEEVLLAYRTVQLVFLEFEG